jgi:beta-glucosidase
MDEDSPLRGPVLPLDGRVKELLSRMTLEEKTAQLGCAWVGMTDLDAPAARGVGQVFRAAATEESDAAGIARRLNHLQREAIEGSRLGIPLLFVEEALCGLQVKGATVFPSPLNLACAFDAELAERVGSVIGRHMRAVGVRRALAPVCDVARDPRWGRVEETYGEDPYLVGMMATGYVRGLQAAGSSESRNMATLKHFVGYSASEGGRNAQPAHLGERELHEVYGVPFEMAIRLGEARGVMVTLSLVDSVAVQGSREYLTDLLRTTYGFQGSVITDADGIKHLAGRFRIAETQVEAAALGVNAGTDSELPPSTYLEPLRQAVAAGKVTEAQIDELVGRLLTEKLRMGLFEEPYVDEAQAELEALPDRDLARTAAERSIVLLRNEKVSECPALPLGAHIRRIAVVGPNADTPRALLCDYAYPVIQTAVENHRQWSADASFGVTVDTNRPAAATVPIPTILGAIRGRAGPGRQVVYAKGCGIADPETGDIAEAVAAAAASDVVVAVVGDHSGFFAAATCGEGIDGACLALPGVQRQLIEAVADTGTPLVVVLAGGRPFALPWLVHLAPAVVQAWFAGEEGAEAIAGILFGEVNPSGRLAVSLPRHPGALPAHYAVDTSRADYFDEAVGALYPFGHGLTYTTFAYSELAFDTAEIPTDGMVEVSCTVTNTGELAGAEVVQLYLHDPFARTSRPVRELKGFQRVELQPGASARLTFEVSADRVALYDPCEGWVTEPGRIDVMIGASSRDIRLEGSFAVVGEALRCGTDRALATPVRVQPLDPDLVSSARRHDG